MKPCQAAIYARVSSEQQSVANTIASQVAELRAYVAARGLSVLPEQEFVDNGYSGATLVRPALEQLRDLAAAGGIDQIYVHCPDRLARNYAHQVLLLEEFARAGVEVIFVNHEVGQSPEDQLLVQVLCITAHRSVRARVQGMSGPMRIIAVLARMPIALEACACVGTSNCGSTRSMKQSGRRSVGSWSIRNAWNKNSATASLMHHSRMT